MADKLTLSAIHARFRQLRSGELADTLASQGIKYRLAWGLESYRLREIAQDFEPSAELAEALWNEDVRESKMLATRLYPVGEMTIAKATAWVRDTKYAEIADQLCMNLLSKMQNAGEVISELAKMDIAAEPIAAYTALMLAVRNEIMNDELKVLAEKIIGNNAPAYLKTAAIRYKQQYDQE